MGYLILGPNHPSSLKSDFVGYFHKLCATIELAYLAGRTHIQRVCDLPDVYLSRVPSCAKDNSRNRVKVLCCISELYSLCLRIGSICQFVESNCWWKQQPELFQSPSETTLINTLITFSLIPGTGSFILWQEMSSCGCLPCFLTISSRLKSFTCIY